MHKYPLLLLACLAGGIGSSNRFSAAQANEIHWFESYTQAKNEAQRTGKPLLVEFRCEP